MNCHSTRGRVLRTGNQGHCIAVALPEGRFECVRQARAIGLGDHKPVRDHQQFLHLREVRLWSEFVEVQPDAVGHDPNKGLSAQTVDDFLVGQLGRAAQREGDMGAGAGGLGEHVVGGRFGRVGAQFAGAHRAGGAAHARPEEPEVVVDLGGGTDGGA